MLCWLSGGDALKIAETLAVLAGCVVAIGAAAKVPFVSKPIHWLWRRNVSGPIAAWFRRLIRDEVHEVLQPVIAELRPNGGASLRDQVDTITRAVGGEPNHKTLTD